MIHPQRFINNSISALSVANTFFSLIVMYFILLFAEQQGWSMLAFIAKAYLMIVLGAFAIIAVAITVFMFSNNIMMFHFRRR